MNVLHKTHVASSGVEYAVSLNLTPATSTRPTPAELRVRDGRPGRAVTNLVVAKNTVLQVFEVREVEGRYRLHHLQDHRLHGVVTGLAKLSTLDSGEDGRDRLLISFKEAKMTLMEWSPSLYDLVPVSFHTFERLPQITQGDVTADDSILALDPQSRCAALLLPGSTLAVLPFTQEQLDFSELGFTTLDPSEGQVKTLPYVSSFVIDLQASVSPKLRNIISVTFLPGFTEPTLAILYQPAETWAGRFENAKDTAALAIVTIDLTESHYPIISEAKNLPADAHQVHACPAELGGVVVVTGDLLLHVDQSGRVVGVATSPWARFSTDLKAPRQQRIGSVDGAGPDTDLVARLDNSRLVFTDEPTFALLFTTSEDIIAVSFVRQGRAVASISLALVGKGSPASSFATIEGDGVFAGCMTGSSALWRWSGRRDFGTVANGPADEMEIDADLEDIYGESKSAAPTRTAPFALALDDTLPAYGPIRHMAITQTGPDTVAEMIACTGRGSTGGLTLFHKGLPVAKRRKLDILPPKALATACTDGRDLIFASGTSSTEVHDAGDSTVLGELPFPTVAAHAWIDGSCVLHVSPSHVRLLDKGLEALQEVQPEPGLSIIRAHFAEPHVLLERRGGGPVLYESSPSRTLRKIPAIEGLDMTSASIFLASLPQVMEGRDVQMATDMDELPTRNWLSGIDSKGDLAIYSLPDLEKVFAAAAADCLPEFLARDEQAGEGVYGSADETPTPRPIEQHAFFLAGRDHPRLHVAIVLENGPTAAYEAVPGFDTPSSLPLGHLALAFVKRAARELEPTPDEDDDEVARTIVRVDAPYRGAFVSGSAPFWLVASDTGPLQAYDDEDAAVVALAPLSDGHARVTADVHVAHLRPSAVIDREIATSLVKTGRSYSHVVYDPPTQCLVAGSFHEAPFANYDDDGEPVWELQDKTLPRPTNVRSSLELIVPGSWSTIDGYEMPSNEAITSMESMDLFSRSTASGHRQFIAISATANRAEDLASKGGLYVFEVVVVEPEPAHPERSRSIRLRYYEETKACVLASADVSGYFLHSMGQKLYMKGLEQDERLLPVGFLDIRPLTVCIRSFKNLILLGDAVKGVTMVAFTEQPYKLVELSHTHMDITCSSVDFTSIDGKLGIAVTDIDGTLRMFEYNPSNIESQAGQKLLLRIEYHMASEVAFSVQYAKRSTSKGDASVLCTLYACHDGSIHSLVPVKELVFKRLQLVQSRIVRRIPQFACLNPRGFRTVRNDTVSRAINRGVLDGDLLGRYEGLSLDQQDEAAGLVQSNRETVLLNLANLKGIW